MAPNSGDEPAAMASSREHEGLKHKPNRGGLLRNARSRAFPGERGLGAHYEEQLRSFCRHRSLLLVFVFIMAARTVELQRGSKSRITIVLAVGGYLVVGQKRALQERKQKG